MKKAVLILKKETISNTNPMNDDMIALTEYSCCGYACYPTESYCAPKK